MYDMILLQIKWKEFHQKKQTNKIVLYSYQIGSIVKGFVFGYVNVNTNVMNIIQH